MSAIECLLSSLTLRLRIAPATTARESVLHWYFHDPRTDVDGRKRHPKLACSVQPTAHQKVIYPLQLDRAVVLRLSLIHI